MTKDLVLCGSALTQDDKITGEVEAISLVKGMEVKKEGPCIISRLISKELGKDKFQVSEDKCQVSEDKYQVSKDKYQDRREMKYFREAINSTGGRKGKRLLELGISPIALVAEGSYLVVTLKCEFGIKIFLALFSIPYIYLSSKLSCSDCLACGLADIRDLWEI
ncbi:hypothetical protein F2Q69_00013392 [Brassica cretica]|uniref:Uncharacterized protein n=1 Tax=Brassica cretica TaxID=69181 RepID=A0A8S9QQP0_BRACR|nr:hypothetical protein F2Q69_00013392 [Brassica cretica]